METIGHLTFASFPTRAKIYNAVTDTMTGPRLANYEGEGPDARHYAQPLTARPRGRARAEDEAWA